MKFLWENEGRRQRMLRVFGGKRNWAEIAYIVFRMAGLQATIEFPSDWHEHRRVWFRFGFGFCDLAFSLPWPGPVSKDQGQCSGHRYGFHFFQDLLFIYYGKDTGTRNDPHIAIHMPWHWRHINKEHKILSEKETHPYTYIRKNGEVQQRTATIHIEQRIWWRTWLPYKMHRRYIEVEFNDEVGERSGSWKGGVLGTSFNMNPGETALEALRRMEAERVPM